MPKGVVGQAVVLAKDSILTSDQFRNRHSLDPMVMILMTSKWNLLKVSRLDGMHMGIFMVIHIFHFTKVN